MGAAASVEGYTEDQARADGFSDDQIAAYKAHSGAFWDRVRAVFAYIEGCVPDTEGEITVRFHSVAAQRSERRWGRGAR